jgi:2-polyprenyl-6-methoxyphenol hydroxylase-like FAD-dependent oxidoreductase
MARIVVAGGGICGMAAAMLLARDGHEIVVLERDEAPVPPDPEASWDSWARRGIGQFRIAHLMLPRGYQILRAELPDVAARLQEAGGLTYNMLADALAAIPGATPREDDARFDTSTGRRPTIEWAFATAADDEPGVTVRRGVAIRGLVAGPSVVPDVPHVIGVVLADGEEVTADLVIDATGRRSPTVEWLAALGGPAPVEEAEDIGFLYTGRFWRAPDGVLPETRAAGLTPCGSISLLTIPSDNCTWSTTIYTVASDAALRAVRQPEVFERVWASFPDHAQWLDGEPISDIATMSGAVDRSRHFVVDGVPVVTGMLTIADAAACTNPSVGRGMSLGLLHTVVMRDAVRQHLADPVALALAFHEATVEQLDPWHQATKDLDHGRIAEMHAAIDGTTLEPTPEAQIAGALAGATTFDADALRWFLELLSCLTLPMELFARPGVFERVLELAPQVPPPVPYGPDRTQLLELVTQ